MQKNVLAVLPSPPGHWVGDGFPVRSLFSYDKWGEQLSPFLLLDYAGPAEFAPATRPRGVGEHPHRGFETVSIVYSGEVAHRDSAGNGGIIGPGDVQWMTAASGILHEEFHSPGFTRRGGALEMAQLWVNLPAKHKMSAPAYQTILDAAIPRVTSPGGGQVRVIAGRFDNQTGPASTFSELNVWDVRVAAGSTAELRVPEGHTTAIAVFKGTVSVNGSKPTGKAELLLLERKGTDLEVAASAENDAVFLLMSGKPIGEPIVGYGPFVMNSRQEIDAAVHDFNAGRFGRMPARATATTAANNEVVSA